MVQGWVPLYTFMVDLLLYICYTRTKQLGSDLIPLFLNICSIRRSSRPKWFQKIVNYVIDHVFDFDPKLDISEEDSMAEDTSEKEDRTLAKEIKPTVGVITALPHEFAAVQLSLDRVEEVYCENNRDTSYTLGEIPSQPKYGHVVLLSLLPSYGNITAATRSAQMSEQFPSLKYICMVGIAGGVPNPDKPGDHVRLGDIVVSSVYGTIQHDAGKDTNSGFIIDLISYTPAASLVGQTRVLSAKALIGDKPWLEWINRIGKQLKVEHPPDSHDVLWETITLRNGKTRRRQVRHPLDPDRVADEPRIFLGRIGSGNAVLRYETKRDLLRDKLKVMAVEMESAGVAQASWMQSIGYISIRGICDYCDQNKNDNWQKYAAVVAAAYFRVLFQSMRGDILPVRIIQKRSSNVHLRDTQAYRNVEAALKYLEHVFTGEIWPGHCDRARQQVTVLVENVALLWNNLEAAAPDSVMAARLLQQQIVLQTNFEHDARVLDSLLIEFRSQCRNPGATAGTMRRNIQQQIAILNSLFDHFRVT